MSFSASASGRFNIPLSNLDRGCAEPRQRTKDRTLDLRHLVRSKWSWQMIIRKSSSIYDININIMNTNQDNGNIKHIQTS